MRWQCNIYGYWEQQQRLHPIPRINQCIVLFYRFDSGILFIWWVDTDKSIHVFSLLFQYHKYSFEWEQHKGKVHPKQTLRSTPNLVPNLMFRTAYGAWLMLSEPPHRTTSDSLRQISYKHTNNVRMIKFHSVIHHKRVYIPEFLNQLLYYVMGGALKITRVRFS